MKWMKHEPEEGEYTTLMYYTVSRGVYFQIHRLREGFMLVHITGMENGIVQAFSPIVKGTLRMCKAAAIDHVKRYGRNVHSRLTHSPSM